MALSAGVEQCWVKRQPRSDADLAAMIATMATQDLGCIRYAGADGSIVGRLHAIGGAAQIDGPDTGYRCASCGEWHDERPTCFKIPLPDVVAALDDDERRRRVESGAERCVLDDTHFFLLRNLDLRVFGTPEVIRWTVWSTLSRANFERASDLWTTEGRDVHTNPVGERPRLEVMAAVHPLAVEQRGSISRRRADELIHAALFGVHG